MLRALRSVVILCGLAACGVSTVSAERPDPSLSSPDTGGGTGSTGGSTGGGTSTTTGGSDPNVMANTPAVVTLSGTLFQPHIGQKLGGALLDSSHTVLTTASTTVDSGGNFTLPFTASPVLGDGYTVDYYADLNGNMFCNVPPQDHSWTVAVPTVAGPTTVAVTHNGDWVPTCNAFGSYSLTFNGINFGGHQAQTFYLSVVDAADNTQVGEVLHGIIPATGQVTFGYPTLLLPGHAYIVAYFADVNGNHQCDSGTQSSGGDHSWKNAVAPASGNVIVQGDHNVGQVEVCTYFPTGPLS